MMEFLMYAVSETLLQSHLIGAHIFAMSY